MRGWACQRAQLSAGLVQHIVSRYTYNITGMVLHACRLDMKERKTRLATPSESGQPTAYDREEVVPRRVPRVPLYDDRIMR